MRAVNPSARLLWCSYGDVALPLVLDVDLPDPATQHGAAAALTHEVGPTPSAVRRQGGCTCVRWHPL